MKQETPMFETNPEKEDEFEKDYAIFQKIIDILKGLGFEANDRVFGREMVRKNWEKGLPFPLTNEGLDGIRISLLKDGKMKVWFTNGFEDPQNPRRQEVVSAMVEAGMEKYVNMLGYKSKENK
jgi:hypothetical protein